MEKNIKTEQVESQMLELNQQFSAFLHTKGIKAKYKLVVENIKNGAKAAPANTAVHVLGCAAGALVFGLGLGWGSTGVLNKTDLV